MIKGQLSLQLGLGSAMQIGPVYPARASLPSLAENIGRLPAKILAQRISTTMGSTINSVRLLTLVLCALSEEHTVSWRWESSLGYTNGIPKDPMWYKTKGTNN